MLNNRSLHRCHSERIVSSDVSLKSSARTTTSCRHHSMRALLEPAALARADTPASPDASFLRGRSFDSASRHASLSSKVKRLSHPPNLVRRFQNFPFNLSKSSRKSKETAETIEAAPASAPAHTPARPQADLWGHLRTPPSVTARPDFSSLVVDGVSSTAQHRPAGEVKAEGTPAARESFASARDVFEQLAARLAAAEQVKIGNHAPATNGLVHTAVMPCIVPAGDITALTFPRDKCISGTDDTLIMWLLINKGARRPTRASATVYNIDGDWAWLRVNGSTSYSQLRIALGAQRHRLLEYGFWRSWLKHTLSGTQSAVDVRLVAMRTVADRDDTKWHEIGKRCGDGVLWIGDRQSQEASDFITSKEAFLTLRDGFWVLRGPVESQSCIRIADSAGLLSDMPMPCCTQPLRHSTQQTSWPPKRPRRA